MPKRPYGLCKRQESDQPAHSRGLIRVFAFAVKMIKRPYFVNANSEDSGQTTRM